MVKETQYDPCSPGAYDLTNDTNKGMIINWNECYEVKVYSASKPCNRWSWSGLGVKAGFTGKAWDWGHRGGDQQSS